ncbi:diguanylate cyclase [Thiomicrorhabdus chilensis]|uniref:diguanylate cyclase n=1 Tax=Thiomicrorhabdus chilensis TaxID=63656 RepID=UPI0004275AAB|nr:diguanylate cyclase [Thiomicrorhabdus chilensis]
MNILIVDPSTSYRKLVSELLSNEDIRITQAASGKEALEYLGKHKPSAVTLAHELGDMNSVHFLRQVNAIQGLQSIPKFLITSNASKEFKREAYDAGFTEIFIKSDFNTLKRAMHSLLIYATVNISAKVLYVEDTQSTADYTRFIMESAGWSVNHVKSGEAAAECLEKERFDLVVTDLVLEGALSGIGLIHLIRHGREEIRNTPILAVSGWNDLLRQVYVLKHGAGDFIAKPFHETDFLARAINLILSKKQLDESMASQKALHSKAHIDHVSGLNNRHYLDEFGHRMVQKSVNNNEAISVCIIDIDYFKSINDNHGHSVGDGVLMKLGELIKNSRHPRDVAVRYGGDEVVMIMPDCGQQQALSKLEQLRVEVEKLKPHGLDITATFGVASVDRHQGYDLNELLDSALEQNHGALDFNALFDNADRSLYMAKNAGRNQICINQTLLDEAFSGTAPPSI